MLKQTKNQIFETIFKKEKPMPIEVCEHEVIYGERMEAECAKCHCIVPQLFISERIEDSLMSGSHFAQYKRVNHFPEILNQFQAKQSTEIPQNIIDDVNNEIRKHKITHLNYIKLKKIIRTTKHPKWYEHINLILYTLGINPPVLKIELEKRLISMFNAMQNSYNMNRPNNRNNFFNYYFVIYKLCQMLGETEYLHMFPMLKSVIKREQQEIVWNKICIDMAWLYIE